MGNLADEEGLRHAVGHVDDPYAAVEVEDAVVVGVDRRLDLVLAAGVTRPARLGRCDGRVRTEDVQPKEPSVGQRSELIRVTPAV